ncbi:family 10 glycosylhydrolase [Gramella sp. AN32]|uniref:Glycoside hydrolase family 10 protein n=1 Tax=Christiangramia antarctica TaxID=2058158 RepID=A0ABW5X0E9_9FLAO|nr:family 10 glycosylhydrolase [Gramella sp. AN32]MCM4154977.1 hypothetical protein [Gramella sp. AN32]
MTRRLGILPIICIFFLFGCKSTQKPVAENPEKTQEVQNEHSIIEEVTSPSEEMEEDEVFNLPPINIAEFRGAWIASVANINWPSKPTLSTENQKKEALEVLDLLENLNFNAVILQVRPQADALYKSDLEPWSYYLTGKSGKAPEPFYDPLEFWINETHKRGMELHVWLNPYRAHHTTGKEIGEKSVIKTNPELVMELKNGMWWMDPANKKVQDKSAEVVLDIVKRYDIDAIHFDDYFYPYASYNGKKDFPDEKSWKEYQVSGGALLKGDWRRKSVNDFIQRISLEIKKEKSYVKFGISPFGIWRPNFPKGIRGMDQYEELFADAKLWLNKGWIDYFSPQLYWSTKQIAQSFPILLGWWESENVTGKHLWPGINLGLEEKEENKGEINSQILIARGILQDNPGVVHWDINQFKKNPQLATALKKGPYANKALVPASPWIDDLPPDFPNPELTVQNEELSISWKPIKESSHYIVYFKYQNSAWDYHLLNKEVLGYKISMFNQENSKLEKIGITSVDRTGNQSNFKEFNLVSLKM